MNVELTYNKDVDINEVGIHVIEIPFEIGIDIEELIDESK